MLKLDLHLHSHYSDDATGTPQELIKILQKKGLHGVSITDHNTIQGSLQALQNPPKNFIIIPGVEISTNHGHLIALNIKKDIPRHLSLEETIDHIHDANAIPIVPHLFRNMSGIKKNKLYTIKSKIPAIEVFNGCSLASTNIKTAKIAHHLNLGGTGGSDSHEPQYAGDAYTTIDTTDTRIDTILEEIIHKKTWGGGTIIPLTYRRDRMINAVKKFFYRGFKRI